MSKKHSPYIQLDLIILLLGFFTVSIISIYNAQQVGQYPGINFAFKQVTYYLLAILVAAGMQFIDLEQLYKSSIYIYIVGTLSVIILRFTPEKYAARRNGAKSWFNEEFPLLTIQPAEFTKISLIIFLAAIIVHHKKRHPEYSMLFDFWLVLKMVLATLLPVAFIIIQPDLGTSIVFFFITGVMIILSGINWRALGILFIGGVTAAGLALSFIIKFPLLAKEYLKIQDHQVKRILTWFDPSQQVKDDTYHIDLALQTIGSGQLTGKGMSANEVFLPEAHTDFIFSIIGESFGFIGAATVIFMFFLLVYRLVVIGMKSDEMNPFGAYICFGFMALILIHTFENIGMTVGIMPITGIPLLFVSYGGSTTLSTIIGFGLVYRVAIELSLEKEYLFK